MRGRFKKPKYMDSVLALARKKKLSNTVGVHHIRVAHDDWCQKLKGGECSCNPDVSLIAMEGNN